MLEMKTFDNGSARAQNHIRKSRKLPFKAEILVMSYMRNFFSGTNLIPSWVFYRENREIHIHVFPISKVANTHQTNSTYIHTFCFHRNNKRHHLTTKENKKIKPTNNKNCPSLFLT